ncbi:2-amino-3,7-dideoxy-D-threo-hept-6-ulosonate synthase [Niallia sp. 03133]|uniref:2-amino-3,7-dideoxy-D-threo-hept-6-ulosonate synthase n=1 Tax=Niallia sp. 03133 TaxID=3458060 RepID=UPI0040442AE8
MSHKSLRLHRLFHPKSKRTILFPLDHGTTIGATRELSHTPELISMASRQNFQGIVAHKGTINWAIESGADTCTIDYLLHLSASTNLSMDVNKKQLVSSVQHGLRIGITGISVHVNLGISHEDMMLKDLGMVCEEAYQWGLPVLAMMNVFESNNGNEKSLTKKIAHGVRVAGELGADLVKVQYSGSYDSMVEVVNAFHIPVLVAGGNKNADKYDTFNAVYNSLLAGGKGISIGRNIFEDTNPEAMCSALAGIVHDNLTPEQAFEVYESMGIKESIPIRGSDERW